MWFCFGDKSPQNMTPWDMTLNFWDTRYNKIALLVVSVDVLLLVSTNLSFTADAAWKCPLSCKQNLVHISLETHRSRNKSGFPGIFEVSIS